MAQRGRPLGSVNKPKGQDTAESAVQKVQQAGRATGVIKAPAKRGDVRFSDVGLAVLFAGGSVLWTATRPTTGSQVGWGAFLTGLGGLAGAEAEGAFLKFAGLGTMGANAAFLALRAFKPDLRPKD